MAFSYCSAEFNEYYDKMMIKVPKMQAIRRLVNTEPFSGTPFDTFLYYMLQDKDIADKYLLDVQHVLYREKCSKILKAENKSRRDEIICTRFRDISCALKYKSFSILVTNLDKLCSSGKYKQIKGTLDLDTRNVTSMDYMFIDNPYGLTYLDLSKLNTSKVTTMTGMFFRCYNLQEVNLSSFDTRNVVDMRSMFGECWDLQRLDLSSFDTSNVIRIKDMFTECMSLQNLDISHFNLENIDKDNKAFEGCKNRGTFKLPANYDIIGDSLVNINLKE